MLTFLDRTPTPPLLTAFPPPSGSGGEVRSSLYMKDGHLTKQLKGVMVEKLGVCGRARGAHELGSRVERH